MEDIKSTVARNITELRTKNNMTQAELGERLNYSDKTISKWERAESTPDVSVLCEIADLFGVTLDSLVRSKDVAKQSVGSAVEKSKYNRRAISYIAEFSSLIVALFAFVITTLVMGEVQFQWLYFVYAVPLALIVGLIFNVIWFGARHSYLIISALMWSVLATIHITFIYFGVNVWLVYLLGAVGQVVIFLSSRIKRPKTK